MTIQTVLFPTDFSDAATDAFGHALAVARGSGARLHLLHVGSAVPPGVRMAHPESSLGDLGEVYEDMTAEAEKALDYLAERAADHLGERLLLEGEDAAEEIVRHASRCGADLVVLGTHGRRAMARLVVGSVAAEVIRRAPCPVMAVREAPATGSVRLGRALVAVDFSPESERAIAVAAELVRPAAGRLDLLHVVEEIPRPKVYDGIWEGFDALEQAEEIRQRCDREMAAMAARAGVSDDHERHLLHGPVKREILDFLRESPADFVAVGRHGAGGAGEVLLGSTAERLLRTAPCPVLTVP
jgi:nucleotide-binding universal stress UspA family protein